MRRPASSFIAPKIPLGLPQRVLAPVVFVTTEGISLQTSPTSKFKECDHVFPAQNSFGDGKVESRQECSVPTQHSFFGATLVTPNIYLGCYADAMDANILLERGITRVLNISKECPISEHLSMHSDVIETMQVHIKDHSDETIQEYFHACIQFIHDAVSRGEKILVHCRMGVSRSATIVLAYLMRYGISGSIEESPISYCDAFDFLKAKRPIIGPNLGFTMALYDWDIIGNPFSDVLKTA
jgi:predicted protein tyrosine phosphatase